MAKHSSSVISNLASQIRAGDRGALSRALTLIESQSLKDNDAQEELLGSLFPLSPQTIRIGVSGLPGAGKSTFIDKFGSYFCNAGRKVAVLAVDPSSPVTGGSILGDKTRMELLSKDERAFIRPSPLGDGRGGITPRTRECIGLCEAAGYSVILVETVGVGQADHQVRDLVDFFLLLTLSGGGDELQSIKRGAIELSDAVIVNKADGDRVVASQSLCTQLDQAFALLGTGVKSFISSAQENHGIIEIAQWLENEAEVRSKSGRLMQTRRDQAASAFYNTLMSELLRLTTSDSQMGAVIEAGAREAAELKSPALSLARRALKRITIQPEQA